MKRRKEKKEIEYEEAPSGYVTMYNYKEPFMRFEKGYGFYGVLLFDGKTDKVQCHFCGDWMQYLGNHLHKEHNMTAADYKTAVGLRQTTALIGETLREKLIANGLDNRKKNLKPGLKKSEETKQKIRETLQKVVAESQNEKGTCPLQLITRLRALHDKLGRTPETDEISFYESLTRVWGSMKDACIAAGIPHRKSGQNIRNPRWTEGKYTKEMLIELMRDFEKKNDRQAAQSDCKRGLLPPPSAFKHFFKSWKQAKRLAYGR